MGMQKERNRMRAVQTGEHIPSSPTGSVLGCSPQSELLSNMTRLDSGA